MTPTPAKLVDYYSSLSEDRQVLGAHYCCFFSEIMMSQPLPPLPCSSVPSNTAASLCQNITVPGTHFFFGVCSYWSLCSPAAHIFAFEYFTCWSVCSLRAQAQRQQISDISFSPPFDQIPLDYACHKQAGVCCHTAKPRPWKTFAKLFTTGVNIYNFVSERRKPDVLRKSTYACGTTQLCCVQGVDDIPALSCRLWNIGKFET